MFTIYKKVIPVNIFCKYSLLFCCLLFFYGRAFAQVCHTEMANQGRKGLIIPQGKTAVSFENWLQKLESSKAHLRLSAGNTLFTIPVVVHIVSNGEKIGEGTNLSAAQVYSQLRVLNQDYNRLNPDKSRTPAMFEDVAGKAGIYFRAARYDTTQKKLQEPGIQRHTRTQKMWTTEMVQKTLIPQTQWNPNQYLNIWVLNLSGNNIGFAYYPVGAKISGLIPNLEYSTDKIDGVVIDYKHFGSNYSGDGKFTLSSRYNRGRTATHEVGHWLGLRHTWGDNLLNCAVDDFCDDTPRTINSSSGIGGNCANTKNTCTEPKNDLPDMLQNFMTYANDVCMNLFTQCQTKKMRIVMAAAERRKQIVAQAPLPPLRLSATLNNSQVRLQWQAPDAEVVSYLLERAEDSPENDFRTIAVVDGTSFIDKNFPVANEKKKYFYRVVALSFKNFSAPSQTAEVSILTGLKNTHTPRIELYPNPAKTVFFLPPGPETQKINKIQIINLNGVQVKVCYPKITGKNEHLQIDISDIPVGIYVIKIFAGDNLFREKLYKQ